MFTHEERVANGKLGAAALNKILTHEDHVRYGKMGAQVSNARKPSLESRFWSHVKKGTAEECWPWQGHKSEKGYGIIKITINKKTISKYTHRICYVITHGAVPDGLHVLHHCDNPPCCNPSHLYSGTNRDNVNDRVKRGRTKALKGVANPCSKLIEDDVRKIRELCNSGQKQRDVAKLMGVSQGTIAHIMSGIVWCHVQ